MAGRAPGSRDATPEEIDAGLEALVRLGTAEAAHAETGVPARTLHWWRERHSRRFATICEAYDSGRKDAIRKAAHDAAKAAAAELPRLTELLGDSDPEIRLKAWSTLTRTLDAVDRMGRLDAGTATSIVGDEDSRSDAELRDAARRWWSQQGVPEEFWPTVLREPAPLSRVQ